MLVVAWRFVGQLIGCEVLVQLQDQHQLVVCLRRVLMPALRLELTFLVLSSVHKHQPSVVEPVPRPVQVLPDDFVQCQTLLARFVQR